MECCSILLYSICLLASINKLVTHLKDRSTRERKIRYIYKMVMESIVSIFIVVGERTFLEYAFLLELIRSSVSQIKKKMKKDIKFPHQSK